MYCNWVFERTVCGGVEAESLILSCCSVSIPKDVGVLSLPCWKTGSTPTALPDGAGGCSHLTFWKAWLATHHLEISSTASKTQNCGPPHPLDNLLIFHLSFVSLLLKPHSGVFFRLFRWYNIPVCIFFSFLKLSFCWFLFGSLFLFLALFPLFPFLSLLLLCSGSSYTFLHFVCLKKERFCSLLGFAMQVLGMFCCGW